MAERERECVFKSICALLRFRADTAGFCRIKEPIFSEAILENLSVYLLPLFTARSLWIIFKVGGSRGFCESQRYLYQTLNNLMAPAKLLLHLSW